MSTNSRKPSAILGLSQYSDSDGSGQESGDEDDVSKHVSKSPTPETGSVPSSVRDGGVLRVQAVTTLSGQGSQSNSPSALFGTSIPGLNSRSPNPLLTQSRSPNPNLIQSTPTKNDRDSEDFPLDEEDRPTSPVSFHKTLENLKESDIVIPPEPPKRVHPSVIEKMTYLKSKKDMGTDMVALIQRRKDLRNPSIYEKLIVHCNIDEFGSNFSSEFYDPHKWAPQSYYESLSCAQKDLMDRREKEKATRAKVEIVVGTKKTISSGQDGAKEEKNREEKNRESDKSREKESDRNREEKNREEKNREEKNRESDKSREKESDRNREEKSREKDGSRDRKRSKWDVPASGIVSKVVVPVLPIPTIVPNVTSSSKSSHHHHHSSSSHYSSSSRRK